MTDLIGLRRYKQTYTPTVVRGGVDGPPLGFCYVTILKACDVLYKMSKDFKLWRS